jgi:hypothetical protein
MTEATLCERHVWASVGVVDRAGSIRRIWECEDCPAWTTEPFDPEYEQAWNDTWLADR